MNAIKILTATVIAGTMMAGAQSAMAYGKGDIFLRGGVAKVDGKSNNGNGLVAKDESGFAGSVGYMFHDKLAVALQSTEEFSTEFEDGAGNFSQMPINLMLQYYPLGGTDARVQPYAGAGLNYTHFSSESAYGQSMDIDDSYGAAAELGVDLNVNESWAVNGFARYADVKADTKINGQDVNDTELDPVTVGAGVTYRF
ncbi:OmpW/AlkL family protein [Cobetia sp. L2A1]|uniref:OmpW/AlkL family protein n=1 Tax=Cobetia sp. L2A1 TaxID=2686360 RepID=UPI00131CD970|nr:OmpW family outer membrane protein [Cobetia sp. L2A1]